MHRDVTVIGASAGSIAPLRQLLSELPADYPAAVFIVVHLAPEAPTVLHTVLNRVSNMPVGLARSGARICTGTVTVACPDLHLLLERDRVIVARGPRENRHRPAIDDGAAAALAALLRDQRPAVVECLDGNAAE